MEKNSFLEQNAVTSASYSSSVGEMIFFGFDGSVVERLPYSDETAFLTALKKELFYNPNGFRYKIFSADPAFLKKVDDIIYGTFGENNPHNVSFCENKEVIKAAKPERELPEHLRKILPLPEEVKHLPLEEQGVFAKYVHPTKELDFYLCAYDPESNSVLGFLRTNASSFSYEMISYDTLCGFQDTVGNTIFRDINFVPRLASSVAALASATNPFVDTMKVDFIHKYDWRNDGTLKSMQSFERGIPHGKSYVWSDNFQLKHEWNHDSGSLLSTKEYHIHNGSVTVCNFYKNGHPKEEFTMKRDGTFHGMYRGWHENGCQSLLCTYKNGKLDGEYITFSAKEDIIKRSIFIGGNEIRLFDSPVSKVKRVCHKFFERKKGQTL